ncbi:helix-turn-helix transcriptional regulator [Gracilibacillus saliphilus]|uniref:helix-turn-helix transcriptional regulator n=1 Tax=Gracilibacillus saliphilus TaxID=543890 RepID=UPI0013D3FF8D|nr:helix-turn-helix transcriptional regulator [Gracilibacillus saliphilus]
MRRNLRHIRISKGYKEVDVIAQKVGISTSYYYKIEQGKRTPSVDLAKKIADVLNCTVDELFYNESLNEMSSNPSRNLKRR